MALLLISFLFVGVSLVGCSSKPKPKPKLKYAPKEKSYEEPKTDPLLQEQKKKKPPRSLRIDWMKRQ